MTTIVLFAWGDAIRKAPEQTACYVHRLYAGFSRFSTLPWRMVLFCDAMNAGIAVPPAVEKRAFDMFEWVGCLPKLYAHSPAAGLSGRVLIVDLDTIICGDVDPLLRWRGPFMSRADEVQAAHGEWQSGGNMQSFEAGTTRALWEQYAAAPEAFRVATFGWERMAIRLYGPPDQTFIQREIPGIMAHMERDCDGKRNSGSPKGASVVIATGALRPHNLGANPLRAAWERLDQVLRVKVVETGPRHRNHIAALFEDSFRARLLDCGVHIVESGPSDVALVHAVGTESGDAIPRALPGEPRMIVVEKVDGPQIHPAHGSQVFDSRVVGWLKSYTVRDAEPRRTLRGRYHAAALVGEGIVQSFPVDRVGHWYGFARYENCRPFAAREPDWSAARSVNVLFRGRVDFPYPGGEPIAAHRSACLEAIRALPLRAVAEAHRWRGDSAPDYVAEMYNAEVAVSPWGYGEACVRDYEALLAGCVLIKPRADYYHGLTDIAPYTVTCSSDWSDLPDAVERARTLYADADYRKAARAVVLREWDDALLAQQVAGRIWRCVGAPDFKPVGKPRVIYRPPSCAQLATPLPRRWKVRRGPRDY